jgi:hypothetical protein
MRLIEFDSKTLDGKIRTGVFDLICLEGNDLKDGQATSFNKETLSQFIDNFVERGDQIPVDWNHQSQNASRNGQPAPALAWYGALALVWDGEIVKAGAARGIDPQGIEGINLSKNGLYAYRTEITKHGHDLLGSYHYLSPTFMSEGTRRDGSDCGYTLLAVAATNTPHQPGTQLTMETAPTGKKTGEKMSKLASVAKLINMEGNADDAAVKQALLSKMEEAAMAAASEPVFNYAAEADKFEEMAKAYEDAHMEAEGDEEPPHMTMRKMAAKFRGLAKMGDPPFGGKESPSEEAAEEKSKMAKSESEGKEKDEAKLAVMEAALEATKEQLAELQRDRDSRIAAERAELERKFESLADAAIAGGFKSEKKKALVAFARLDFEAARASVEHFLPKSGAPAHVFDRASRAGGPLGGDTKARSEFENLKPRRVHSMGAVFVETDSHFADEIKRVAGSKEPHIMEKVDSLLTPAERPVMFNRLRVAERIVRAERPDLVKASEG